MERWRPRAPEVDPVEPRRELRRAELGGHRGRVQGRQLELPLLQPLVDEDDASCSSSSRRMAVRPSRDSRRSIGGRLIGMKTHQAACEFVLRYKLGSLNFARHVGRSAREEAMEPPSPTTPAGPIAELPGRRCAPQAPRA